MSTILLVYFSLAVILVNAAYLVRPWHLSDCHISLDGISYYVCPIFEREPMVVGLGTPYDHEKMNNQSFYRFDFWEGDSAVEEGSDVGVSQCEPGSWICLHLNGEPEPVRVAGFDNVRSYVSGESTDRVYVDDHGHIIFMFLGGYYDGRRQSARIEFICDPDVDETKLLSFPEFSNKVDDVHFFTWATKYGCSIPMANLKEDLGSTFVVLLQEASDGDGDGEREGEDSSEDELLPPSTPSSRRWTGTVFLIALIIMLGFGYVICYPPMHLIDRYVTPLYERITRLPVQMRKARVRPFASKKRKNNKNFRVNEGRLVGWAAEDSRLLGEEEDVMVNTYDEDDDDDWPMDGYIPLRPGMNTGRIKNYGTA